MQPHSLNVDKNILAAKKVTESPQIFEAVTVTVINRILTDLHKILLPWPWQRRWLRFREAGLFR
ncbi:hypothetical protein Hdeb2414_s0006g00195391 [Helianthus debilis subsp. tardiflorus]